MPYHLPDPELEAHIRTLAWPIPSKPDVVIQAHGVVKALHDMPSLGLQQHQQGFVTAYLPEDRIVGLFFGEGKWLTIKESEAFLEENFDIIMLPEIIIPKPPTFAP